MNKQENSTQDSMNLKLNKAILYELENLSQDSKVYRRDANIFFLSNREEVKRLFERKT
ncbi:hypothetical protein FG379_003230 [Cryptosporidium bovis]|uniref:uncharacterized protein n=1 Tax=Cryptosporidium bovis TaxID=310047 RepID=UPI00351A4603|nr:hypothetical protein FG379_003230 [Cryptosporidium bovis]